MPSPSYPLDTTNAPGEGGIIADLNQAYANINDLNDRTPALDFRTRYGTGSPEGAVTAPVGALYSDTANTLGAGIWRKAAGGAGSTGWKVMAGDTGLRNIKALLKTDVSASVEAMTIQRIGYQVRLNVEGLTAPSGVYQSFLDLPVGFTQNYGSHFDTFREGAVSGVLAAFGVGSNAFAASGITSGASAHRWYGQFFYMTDAPWPTALPGTLVA